MNAKAHTGNVDNTGQPLMQTEVGKALMTSKRAFIWVGVFSAFINLLMLTGPLYMLQVYDRVLASGSMSTLVGITVLMAMMFLFMGYFDLIRSRILIRVGDKLENDLSKRTFAIWLKQGLFGRAGQRHQPLNDLNALRQFFSGAAPTTFFDIPWAPIYIAVMFLFHPLLGWAGIVGAIIIFILALLNEKASRKPLQDANTLKAQAQIFARAAHRNADSVTAMGMGGHIQTRWQSFTVRAAQETVIGSDISGGLTSASKAFRMLIQSSILGLGAALAVQQVITPGTMIAGSIVMGRALAPIQMVVGQWRGFISTRQAFHRLNKFYTLIPEDEESLQLPIPTGKISVENIIAAPPGSQTPVLNGLNFSLEPGQGLGVIGPSASGKSTLARLLVGIWMPQKGSVRLDGAPFDQWNREQLGPYIGYLPQEIEMFDGSIGENISRFNPEAKAEDIVLAAKRADVHDMVLRLSDGYDTKIGEGGAVLSGGQNQRIALARALFGDPVLIVMDEPNANLDAEGDAALSRAITDLRERQKTVIIMAHRPSAIAAVDTLLILKDGHQMAFGPKDEVMEEYTKAKTTKPDKERAIKNIPSTQKPNPSKVSQRVSMPSFATPPTRGSRS